MAKFNPKQERKKYISRIEHLESDLVENEGVFLFDEENGLDINKNFLMLPSDITDAPSQDLGEYLNAFTQQKMYLRTIQSRTDLVLEKKRRIYQEKSAIMYNELTSKGKLSESAKERMINTDEEITPLYYDYLDYLKKRDLISSAIENIEDAIFLISREVTRRTGDFNDENRTYSVKGKR